MKTDNGFAIQIAVADAAGRPLLERVQELLPNRTG
jgi:hypothetical protein